MLVAEHHARQGLHLDILHRVALDAGEVTHLALREGDVLDGLFRQSVVGRGDILGADAEIVGRPVVELQGVFAGGRVAPGRDVGDDGLYGGANLGVRRRRRAFGDACLEIAGQAFASMDRPPCARHPTMLQF